MAASSSSTPTSIPPGSLLEATASTLPWCQVWLRHGEKSHDNGKATDITGYSHDPELTDTGCQQIHHQTIYLLERFAPPEQITCSPFLRCRQSALVMQNAIASITGVVVPIVTDRWIGEYLGNHPHLQLEGAVSPQTLESEPLVRETLISFKKKRIPNIVRHNPYQNHWYVTHGIVVDHLISHWQPANTVPPPKKYIRTPTGSGFTLVNSHGASGKVNHSVTILKQRY